MTPRRIARDLLLALLAAGAAYAAVRMPWTPRPAVALAAPAGVAVATFVAVFGLLTGRGRP